MSLRRKNAKRQMMKNKYLISSKVSEAMSEEHPQEYDVFSENVEGNIESSEGRIYYSEDNAQSHGHGRTISEAHLHELNAFSETFDGNNVFTETRIISPDDNLQVSTLNQENEAENTPSSNVIHSSSVHVDKYIQEYASSLEYSNSSSESESDYKPEEISDCDSDDDNSPVHCRKMECIPETKILNEEISEAESIANEEKIVVVATNNVNGERKFDKQYYCLFCNRPFAKLPRHLETQHAEESEVKEIIELKNQSQRKKRNNLLKKLRNIGNHKHNCSVLKSKRGKLFVVYRPQQHAIVEASNYMPCPTCYGYYSRREMWKHKCPFREHAKKHQRILAASQQLIPVPVYISENIKEIFSSMRRDPITLTAMNDKIICEFVKTMYYTKGGTEPHKKSEIRNNAREMSRLLKEFRKGKGNESCSVEMLINSANYNDILNAVRQVSGYDSKKQIFSAPELARKLGLHLKSCARVVQKIALEQNNTELLERSERFLKLHELRYYEEIGAVARRNKNSMKRKKEECIPLSKDVIKLNDYLKALSEKCMRDLNELEANNKATIDSWITLQKVTLVRLIVFNRRREGEVSRMKIVDFAQRKDPQQMSDVEETLSKAEKALCRLFTRIEIRGKCDRNVPVLLTPDMVKAIQMLLQWREIVGVAKENDFLFASCTYGALLHYRGSHCLRKFSEECGAAHPETLRSTKLRKHVASVSQVLNLKENELDILAKFMGHDIKIHREFYRLPDNVLQVAKLSKLFLSLDEGVLHKNMGRSLDEIQVSENSNLEKETVFINDNYAGDAVYDFDGELETEQDSHPDAITEGRRKENKIIDHKLKRRRPWTQEERDAVDRHLMSYILRRKIPGAAIIKQCIVKEPPLINRDWRNIKDFCRNRITLLKKGDK